MVTVDELRDAWAEMQRHKQIALLALDGKDIALAKKQLEAALSTLKEVVGHLTFDIPYPGSKRGKAAFCKRFGLNAYYSGKHWAARKKDAEELHALTLASMKNAKIRRKMLNRPVSITFLWDDRMDIDNHAAIAKAVVDAMKGYILPDDNPQFYRKVTHEFWGGGCIRVEVSEL